MSREIVLDTETTGLDPKRGDRIVEIGCVEVVNRFLTGRTFHCYINPERSMPPEAFAVHGLSDGFLKDKPKFAEVAGAFMDFIGDAQLVIHNAAFDMGFINHELQKIGRDAIGMDRVIDTVMLARRKHPGQQNSLDALCDRYGVDRSKRTRHGALLDSELLAEVYAELTGGRQQALALAQTRTEIVLTTGERRERRRPPPSLLTEEEREAHRTLVASLGPKALWSDFLTPEEG
jgi:DNA polymerase-3 subunit epsilon